MGILKDILSAEFFVAYILSIAVSRIFLIVWPVHARKIGRFQPHHYMYGLLLAAIYFFIPSPIILGVGLGLIVDEIPLFFIFKTWDWPDDHWKEYHSRKSVVGILLVSLLVYGLVNFWVFITKQL